MRTSNSVKNSITVLLSNSISFIIVFIAQAFFIRILGTEYLGLNGLFTNVLTLLSIFELGIGNAIVFNLYKPIAENDHEKISSLVLFYKKIYNIIALVIFIIGIMLIPFIKYIVNDITIDVNIYVVYLLFLISTITSYMMVYKRNLIIANQHNYIVNIVHMFYLIILNTFQILVLYFTKNYYLYLLLKIALQIVENLILTLIANKKYNYINLKYCQSLDRETEKDIFKRVKALIFHKIGTIVISGTDNIIISSFLGIIQVGLYSNYYTIINAVNNIFGQIILANTASVGNLLVTSDNIEKYNAFKKIRFLNFWISTFTSICILIIINPFIKIWLGNNYLLSEFTVIIIVLNYFQKMQRNTYIAFKDSGGIWSEDKYIPIIESILNIIFSIIFLKFFGLAGVIMGTIISGLALWCYSYPKFVYKKVFDRSYISYIKETVGYIIIFIICASITYLISKIIIIENILIQLLLNAIVCLIIPNLILFILFRKTENFEYFLELIVKILGKFKRKKN